MRACAVALALLLAAAGVGADVVSDHLERALALNAAGKLIEAKVEIEKALAAITPLAKAQIPKPEVKGRTYVNYELAFRVTCPEEDWGLSLLRAKGTGGRATYPLCQISYVKPGHLGDDMALFYARDLKAFLGPRYDNLKGKEREFVRKAGRQMASSIRQLTDVQITGQRDMEISGCLTVLTDYRAKKGAKQMKCFTIQVLRDHMLFTGMFVGNLKNDKDVAPAFKQILDSVDLSPVTMPEKK